uniref:Uncharacterized protein n=1 Tax=Daphnia magna TaxID=35525 RepID=A0A0P6H4G3_9CRUS
MTTDSSSSYMQNLILFITVSHAGTFSTNKFEGKLMNVRQGSFIVAVKIRDYQCSTDGRP